MQFLSIATLILPSVCLNAFFIIFNYAITNEMKDTKYIVKIPNGHVEVVERYKIKAVSSNRCHFSSSFRCNAMYVSILCQRARYRSEQKKWQKKLSWVQVQVQVNAIFMWSSLEPKWWTKKAFTLHGQSGSISRNRARAGNTHATAHQHNINAKPRQANNAAQVAYCQ